MENIPPTSQSPAPMSAPQGRSPLVGPVLIAIALLLVGGGVVWALTRPSTSTTTETPTPTPSRTGTVSTPTPATGGTKTPAPTGVPTPTPTQTTSGSIYNGQWNGRFTSANTNCPSGNISFSVSSTGSMVGTATTDIGVGYSGGGNVDSNGNISAGWTYGSANLNLSGKLLTSGTGSGSYSTNTSCSGTFSVQR